MNRERLPPQTFASLNMSSTNFEIRKHEPLASKTTLEVGGAAQYFCQIHEDAHLLEALSFATEEGLDLRILGGGSNLVIRENEVRGLVAAMKKKGRHIEEEDGRYFLRAGAGEIWDEVVEQSTRAGFYGLECLSGIPGTVGATPIQNVGAYGQEVADTIVRVRVYDLERRTARELTNPACRFAYRDSRFKAEPDRFIVLDVWYELSKDPTKVRYGELSRALESTAEVDRSPELLRETVLRLRAQKSMVWSPSDPNHRSCGSFFKNPVVSMEHADWIEAETKARGLWPSGQAMPRFALSAQGADASPSPSRVNREWGPSPTPEGAHGSLNPLASEVKLAAAWLVERAGYVRGTKRNKVGLSSVHALALVHWGEGSAKEILDFAREIQDGVKNEFRVDLEMEPVIW